MQQTLQTYITQHGFIPFPPIADEATIKDAIHELASSEKTKGTHLFKRFYENDNALFWQFRTLNADPKNISTSSFQEIGEQVVGKLRILEQILTDKMLKRDTDKTITAFYDHVRLFFPLFDQVGVE
jgi:hypothetical protein